MHVFCENPSNNFPYIDFCIKFDPIHPKQSGCQDAYFIFTEALTVKTSQQIICPSGGFHRLDRIGFPERLSFKTDKWKHTLDGRYG